MQISQFQVPIEKREYLKDQKEKTGAKDNSQLGSIDKYAVKKILKKSLVETKIK